MYRIITIVLVVSLQLALGQFHLPRAVLYESRNQLGQYLVIPQTYVPDLNQNNFDNRAQSACVNGTWVFYVNPHYNTRASSGVEYAFGSNYCFNFATVGGSISSARFAGDAKDYRNDSLTIYQDDYFQGDEEYLSTSVSNINLAGNHSSVIITGVSGWTIFDQPSYSGNSICLTPQPSSDKRPYFITDLSQIQVPHGSIKSVKKGCAKNDKGDEQNVAEVARFGNTE